jgi:pyruvate formate lyase activating enzyme
MLGCDYHCPYCQNWLTSQALRDPSAIAPVRDVEPDDVVDLASRGRSPVMVSTYNEPLVTSEWAVEIFSRAKKAGIVCGYVSNGNGTPEVLRYLRPHVDLFKVDLKAFRDKSYRRLGGVLDKVLDTIQGLHGLGFWVEIVTLLVPGFNDSEEELRDLTGFIASVSADMPWHVTAFHQNYRMTGPDDTDAAGLVRAARIGTEAGLRFVYAGNLPGRVGDLENTRCPGCGETVIERRGYAVRRAGLSGAGSCAACGAAIPGVWQAPA